MDDHIFYLSMKNYGGHFVKAMAEAYSRADGYNRDRIKDAFPDLVKQYGLGSYFYGQTWHEHRGSEGSKA